MPAELLQRMRELRHKARTLARTVAEDHRPFQQDSKQLFYFRLPSKPAAAANPPSVTPTCTAWMALCTARAYAALYKSSTSAKDAYNQLLQEPWDTGGLKQNNAFTIAVVSRAVGSMVDAGHLALKDVEALNRKRENKESDGSPITDDWRKCHDRNLPSILIGFLEDPIQAIALAPFPASPTIGYWMIDAASHLKIELNVKAAKVLATWCAAEFRRQISLVAACQQAIMDPVALAMAACACKALRRISDTSNGVYEALKEILFPSDSELEAGIREFFLKQNEQSGVWEKYFPIFHYPASGPNHCWHFEVLEAVIGEFPGILNDAEILRRLGLSLSWLTSNRLTFRHDKKSFSGWNAGGDIQAMRRGEPESWPTGVAHMFLARLIDQLSACIHATVLDKLGDRVRFWPKDGGEEWKKYMDFQFLDAKKHGLVDERNSVKKIIEKEIIEPCEADLGEKPLSPHFKLEKRRSAVLFGPPGTSKTTLCEAVSKRLGWHFVELSPSDFLGAGLEGIYNKVSELFDDLMDLYGVVVLFDEMDALVQSRDSSSESNAGNPLDVSQKLLTTSMLPKLQQLNKGRRVIFFMATNYIGDFDGAIIRSGRFDLLVHMGPPSTAEKISGLRAWCKNDKNADVEAAQKLLSATLVDDSKERFDRFTFGETGRFLYSLQLQQGKASEAAGILSAGSDVIKHEVKEWAKLKITLNDESKTDGALADYLNDAGRVCIQ